jgi:aspartate racemase
MKTIGLVGGTTWTSSLDYYRYFNEMVNEHLGGDEAAKVILNSVNYGEIKQLIDDNDWKAVSAIICTAAKRTEDAGADCILLGANTLHYIAEAVEQAVTVPLIHIVKETAKEIKKLDIDTIALLGTKYTMQLSFFRDILTGYGIETLVPSEEGMEKIDNAIYAELAKGMVLDPTKKTFIAIIDKLAGLGADAVVLGCTEIPLLIKQEDCPLPLFDTAKIHARAAVNFVLDLSEEVHIKAAAAE